MNSKIHALTAGILFYFSKPAVETWRTLLAEDVHSDIYFAIVTNMN